MRRWLSSLAVAAVIVCGALCVCWHAVGISGLEFSGLKIIQQIYVEGAFQNVSKIGLKLGIINCGVFDEACEMAGVGRSPTHLESGAFNTRASQNLQVQAVPSICPFTECRLIAEVVFNTENSGSALSSIGQFEFDHKPLGRAEGWRVQYATVDSYKRTFSQNCRVAGLNSDFGRNPSFAIGDFIRFSSFSESCPNQEHAYGAECHTNDGCQRHNIGPKRRLLLRYQVLFCTLIFTLFGLGLGQAISLLDRGREIAGLACLSASVSGVFCCIIMGLNLIFR
ncbi:hypothetical protein NMD1_00941 [Novosphingobium sp. MD-1]|nr:hypothetical protein NMD1_00941 [Novosphingobium sp. MD-1]